jgi:hypothetical protein
MPKLEADPVLGSSNKIGTNFHRLKHVESFTFEMGKLKVLPVVQRRTWLRSCAPAATWLTVFQLLKGNNQAPSKQANHPISSNHPTISSSKFIKIH